MGKGDHRRPGDNAAFRAGWERMFGPRSDETAHLNDEDKAQSGKTDKPDAPPAEG